MIFNFNALSAADMNIGKIFTTMTNGANKETKTIQESENLNNDLYILINILEDPIKLNKLIETLKSLDNNSTIDDQSKVKDELNSVSDIVEKFHLSMLKFNKIFSLDSLNEEINYINHYLLHDWLIWILAVFSILLLYFTLEKTLSLLVVKNKNNLLNHMGHKNKHNKSSIFSNMGNLIVVFLPVLASFILSLVVLNLFIKIAYYKHIINILVLLLLIRILSYFIYIVFYQLKKRTFKKLAYWLNVFLYTILLFFIFNSLLLELNSINKDSLLLKINLIVFIIPLIYIFLRIKSLVLKIISKGFTKSHGQHNIAYRYFILRLKKNRMLIFTVLLVTSLFCIILFDYNLVKHMLLSMFFVLLSIFLVYVIYKVSYYALYKYIVIKNNTILQTLKQSLPDFNSAYHHFSSKKLFGILDYTYKILIVFLLLFAINKSLNLGLINVLIDIYHIPIISSLLSIIIAFIVISLISLAIILFVQYIVYASFIEGDTNKIKKTLSLFLLCKKPYLMLSATIYIVLILLFLGVPINALLASTGILTIVFAFGAKDMLHNFFNGILFVIEDSFSLNDIIVIDDKKGVVEGMSLIYVKLRDADGSLHLIPFSSIGIITNHSKEYSLAVVDIGVSYNADIDYALKVMENTYQILIQNDQFKKNIIDKMEVVGVTSLNDFSINIRVKVRTLPGKQYGVKYEFLKLIHQEFKKNDIEIPYPHHVIINKQ